MECYIDQELIFRDISADKFDDVLKIMADKLYEKKLVKKDYAQEVIDREKYYPTGLYTGDINIAIPHCDYKFVNKKSIALGILKNPIKVYKMDEPKESINVSIVLMLAIDDPNNHINFLTKIFSLVQSQDQLKKLYTSENNEEILEILNKNL